MIEIRLSCENCDKVLAPNSEDAMICGFACTFCKDCVKEVLQNVCPNCGGGFEKRPVMPKKYLEKYPPRQDKVYKPINMEQFKVLRNRNKNIPPAER